MRTLVTFVGLVAVLALSAGSGPRGTPAAADQFPSIVRLGPWATQLTADDLAEIEGLGGAAWMIIAHRPGLLLADGKINQRFVSVFVRSQRSAAQVRRGLLLHLTGNSSEASGRTRWTVSSKGEWFQVPVPGRDVDAIDGPRDSNRPFPVTGSIADDSLHEAITVIRTSPRIPPLTTTRPPAPVHSIFTDVRGSWPVQRVVVRDASTLTVYLLDDDQSEGSGQEVTLSRSAGGWKVGRLRSFVID
jgi:hypothetical protein